MFEAVAGAAAGDPYIVKIRMPVEYEIAVGRVLVLADARFNYRTGGERGEVTGNVIACGEGLFRSRQAVAGIWVKCGAVQIECNFEPARFNVGEAVHALVITEVDPDGHFRRLKSMVARGKAEEEYFLACGEDAAAEERREYFRIPWAAREDERVGSDSVAGCCDHSGKMAVAFR